MWGHAAPRCFQFHVNEVVQEYSSPIVAEKHTDLEILPAQALHWVDITQMSSGTDIVAVAGMCGVK